MELVNKQDQMAVDSHQKAFIAQQDGLFDSNFAFIQVKQFQLKLQSQIKMENQNKLQLQKMMELENKQLYNHYQN